MARTLIRWLGTAAGIIYVATLISLDDLRDAAARISAAAMIAATALVALNVVIGAVRWRALLAAYGADERPSLARASRLYFEAFFFNNYLPGAVVGDVIRGVKTRGLAVVFVERALGLAAIFALLAIGLAGAGDIAETRGLGVWSVIGIAGSFALVLALPIARRIAPRLPQRLRAFAEKIPPLSSAPRFAEAAAWSLGTQACVALAGFVLLHAIEPHVTFADSLLIVPLAAATTFLPFTVGGAGARETVYVTLGARLFHMSQANALAASLALWLAHLLVGAAGGILHLIGSPDTSR